MDNDTFFQEAGLEVVSVGDTTDSDSAGIEHGPKLVLNDSAKRFRIVAAFGVENSLYDHVLKVRQDEDGHAAKFDFDAWSTHYVLFYESDPIGSMTVTRHKDGPVDCDEFYPKVLFQRYGDVLVSICKFRIRQGSHTGLGTFRTMTRAVWRNLLEVGVRVDVINIEKSNMVAFRRIGYQVIEGSDFVHPKLGTDSIAMVLSADPTRRSFFSDLFETEIEQPVLMAEVMQAIESTQPVDLKESSAPALNTPLAKVDSGTNDAWEGYGDYQNHSQNVREYYNSISHCLSLALHDALSTRCQLALDIACGSGTSTRIVSRFSDRVIGVDSSPELIQQAKSADLGRRFEFVLSRIEDFQCEYGTFDLVSASWYMNYLHSEEELIAFVDRVVSLLKPAGHVAFVVPGASYASDEIQTIAREEFGWQQATVEIQPDYTRVVFCYGGEWIKTTIWQPLKLMRLLDNHFHIGAWDVKATLAYEQRLKMLNTEPPFEVIYGTLRQKGRK